MKRVLISISALLIIIYIVLLCVPGKKYTYTELHFPPTTYEMEIKPIVRVLKGTFFDSCSAVNCEGSTESCFIFLTRNEYKNIMKLWDDKDILSPILQTLCENDEIFYQSYKESLESLDDYTKMDLNSDGKITSREFANQWLNEAVNR